MVLKTNMNLCYWLKWWFWSQNIYIRIGKVTHGLKNGWRNWSNIINKCHFYISNSTAKGYNMQKIYRLVTFPPLVFVFQLNVLICWALIKQKHSLLRERCCECGQAVHSILQARSVFKTETHTPNKTTPQPTRLAHSATQPLTHKWHKKIFVPSN